MLSGSFQAKLCYLNMYIFKLKNTQVELITVQHRKLRQIMLEVRK